ncbi:unnamed protein product [Sphagnum jensenii]|uniref:RecA family profile 2 domain-containing protein n=1 Tax=Sphagnum jensenii TaxID=128206 RepID=A0ABP1BX94_9BRYO
MAGVVQRARMLCRPFFFSEGLHRLFCARQHNAHPCISYRVNAVGVCRPTFFTNSVVDFSTGTKKGKGRQKQQQAESQPEDCKHHAIVECDERKHQLLQAAIAQVTKQYGKESVMWLGRNQHVHVDVISTGSLTLDIALGVGGLPKRSMGLKLQGKQLLHFMSLLKLKSFCLFVDAEHALDLQFAEGIGVNTRDLLFVQPDAAEQALETVDTFVRSGTFDVIVIDSVAALVPKAELEGEMGDSQMALQARLMSKALRKLTHSLNSAQTVLIFLNQTRHKLSTFGGMPSEVTAGGNALKFYASVRLNIKRKSQLKRGDEAYGNEVTVKVVKNKVAPPFKTAEFDIEFGRGISREGEILDLGVKHHLLKLSGSWYSYEEKNFANGKDNAKRYLREHKEFSDTLMKAIKDKLLGMSSEVNSTRRMEGEDIAAQEGTWEVDFEDEEEIAL